MGGFWDVGAMEFDFEQPLYFHRISAAGLVEVAAERHAQTTFPSITCGGVQLYEAKFSKKLTDYPSVDEPIANFYLRQPLPVKAIQVQTSLRIQQLKFSAGEPSINTKTIEEVKVKLYEIDLDKDGVTDVLVENFYSKGAMGGLNSNWRRYINVQGHWLFVDANYEEDCT
jgi:hypothetical protein